MDLDLQGKIERFTLPEIFQLVSTGRKTGTLGIQRDDDIVMVYFRNGSVVYGYGPRKTYHIGQMLMEMGRITSAQLDDVIAEQASPVSGGKRLGQLMIEKRYIDRADLEEAIRKQVEELIFSLMSWDRGSFKFYEDQFPTEEEITINLSVENVILEGLRRLDEMNRVKDCLPDASTVYALAPAESGQIRNVSLRPEEWNVLALVDGRRSIDDILIASPLGSMETLHHLASLQLAGLVKPATHTADHDKLESMVDHLSQMIEGYLTRNTGAAVAGETPAGPTHDQI
jgi:hypothetical protein